MDSMSVELSMEASRGGLDQLSFEQAAKFAYRASGEELPAQDFGAAHEARGGDT